MSVVREHLHRMPFRKPPWEGSMLGREGSVGKSTYALSSLKVQVYIFSTHERWERWDHRPTEQVAFPSVDFFKGKPCFLILIFK